MTAHDPIQEFKDTLILQQGILGGFVLDPPKIALRFQFPKRFEIHFIRVEHYRADMPLHLGPAVKRWSAYKDSEFLTEFLEQDRPVERSKPDFSSLCHFHVEFHRGHLDVLADDAVFMMVAR